MCYVKSVKTVAPVGPTVQHRNTRPLPLTPPTNNYPFNPQQLNSKDVPVSSVAPVLRTTTANVPFTTCTTAALPTTAVNVPFTSLAPALTPVSVINPFFPSSGFGLAEWEKVSDDFTLFETASTIPRQTVPKPQQTQITPAQPSSLGMVLQNIDQSTVNIQTPYPQQQCQQQQVPQQQAVQLSTPDPNVFDLFFRNLENGVATTTQQFLQQPQIPQQQQLQLTPPAPSPFDLYLQNLDEEKAKKTNDFINQQQLPQQQQFQSQQQPTLQEPISLDVLLRSFDVENMNAEQQPQSIPQQPIHSIQQKPQQEVVNGVSCQAKAGLPTPPPHAYPVESVHNVTPSAASTTVSAPALVSPREQPMFGSPVEHASDVSDGSPDMSPLAFFAEPSASVSPPPQQEASPAEDPATKPVSKKRARDSSDDDDVFVKPLPVKRSRISSDEEEKLSPEALIKRQRNTEAARRSRQRKVEKMEGLQDQVRDLENDRNKLKLRVAVLENERSSWNAREKELLSRVSHLEQQLAESHRAMLAFGIRG